MAIRSVRARVTVVAGEGQGRGIGWPLARLLIGDEDLTVHSRMPGWVPTRSARKPDVGEISGQSVQRCGD